jgi:hypothetical protein
MRQVLKAISTCVAKGTIRIFGTCVLNTIIVKFMILNYNIIIVENEISESNPKPSLRVYS